MMHIEFEIRNDLCILRLKGRFKTGSDADYLRARAELKSIGYRKLLLDCRDLDYLDSTGISFIIGLYNRLRGFGGRLVVALPNARVQQVLHITRVDTIVPVSFSEEEALEVLGARVVPLRACSAA